MSETAQAVEVEADMLRSCGDYRIAVWFRPDLAAPVEADVIVYLPHPLFDRVVDCVTVDAVDAVDAFRHPAIWSRVVRDSLQVQS